MVGSVFRDNGQVSMELYSLTSASQVNQICLNYNRTDLVQVHVHEVITAHVMFLVIFTLWCVSMVMAASRTSAPLHWLQ